MHLDEPAIWPIELKSLCGICWNVELSTPRLYVESERRVVGIGDSDGGFHDVLLRSSETVPSARSALASRGHMSPALLSVQECHLIC